MPKQTKPKPKPATDCHFDPDLFGERAAQRERDELGKRIDGLKDDLLKRYDIRLTGLATELLAGELSRLRHRPSDKDRYPKRDKTRENLEAEIKALEEIQAQYDGFAKRFKATLGGNGFFEQWADRFVKLDAVQARLKHLRDDHADRGYSRSSYGRLSSYFTTRGIYTFCESPETGKPGMLPEWFPFPCILWTIAEILRECRTDSGKPDGEHEAEVIRLVIAEGLSRAPAVGTIRSKLSTHRTRMATESGFYHFSLYLAPPKRRKTSGGRGDLLFHIAQ